MNETKTRVCSLPEEKSTFWGTRSGGVPEGHDTTGHDTTVSLDLQTVFAPDVVYLSIEGTGYSRSSAVPLSGPLRFRLRPKCLWFAGDKQPPRVICWAVNEAILSADDLKTCTANFGFN